MPKGQKRPARGQGTPHQRKDGRWCVTCTVYDGIQPKRKYIYADTQAECAKKLREIMSAVDNNTYSEPSKFTVEEWLNIWIEKYKPNIKDSTREKYRSIIDVHIVPALGKIKIVKLNSVQVQNFISSLISEKGLSASTVSLVYSVLEAAVNDAYAKDVITGKNPCARGKITLPRKEPRKQHVLDTLEIRKVFDYLAEKDSPYINVYRTALLTGMRRGEIQGLCWEDIDFENRIITVNRQLHRIKKGEIDVSTPKSNKSRQIPLAPALIPYLEEERKKQRKNREALGLAWLQYDELKNKNGKPLHLVFTLGNGDAISNDIARRNFENACAAVGIHDIVFHDIRHTFATHALENGLDMKSVQDALGHYSASETLDLYGHVLEEVRNENGEKISNALGALVG